MKSNEEPVPIKVEVKLEEMEEANQRIEMKLEEMEEVNQRIKVKLDEPKNYNQRVKVKVENSTHSNEKRAMFALTEQQKQILSDVASTKQDVPKSIDNCVKVFRCPKCSNEFESLNRLLLHVDSAHENFTIKVRCPECHIVLYGSGYERHCLVYHKDLLLAPNYLLNPLAEAQETTVESPTKKKDQPSKHARMKGTYMHAQRILPIQPKPMKVVEPNRVVLRKEPQGDIKPADPPPAYTLQTSTARGRPLSHPSASVVPDWTGLGWTGLLSQAARHFRDADAAMIGNIRRSSKYEMYKYTTQDQIDLLPKNNRTSHAYADLKKKLLFSSNVTSLPFFKSMQNLSKSSKISKRILTTFKGNLSSAAMGAVERQLKRQETALEKLCSNPPSMSHHPMGSVRPSSVGPPSTASTQRSSPSPSSSPVPRITFQPTASSPVGLDSRLSHLTFTPNKMVRVLQGKEGTKVFYQGRLPRDQQILVNKPGGCPQKQPQPSHSLMKKDRTSPQILFSQFRTVHPVTQVKQEPVVEKDPLSLDDDDDDDNDDVDDDDDDELTEMDIKREEEVLLHDMTEVEPLLLEMNEASPCNVVSSAGNS